MSKFDKIMNRLLIIFIYIGIGQLVASYIGKYEMSNAVLIGYLVIIPLSIVIAIINNKKLKKNK